jgi:hypothetical protein
MDIRSLLVEMLLSSFFALACFRARAQSPALANFAPRELFVLVDRLERLRRTRWQWFSMVLVLVVVRMQLGIPMVAEVTALLQFIIFLALPSQQAG